LLKLPDDARIKDLYLVAHPTNRKWVISPVISGLTLLIPFITGVEYPLTKWDEPPSTVV
jgi:hypothetical protein